MILQFKITLRGTKPPIWRRFQVEDNITFRDLHLVIQTVMGWSNTHLYQFIYERDNYIGNPEMLDAGDVANDRELKLSEIFDNPGIKMVYEYDMGDGWEHDLVLEKIVEKDSSHFFPCCLDGALNCPPEDIGGVPGFYERMKILKNKKHPEYQDIKEWLGDEYDASFFDLQLINDNLKTYKDIDDDFN